MNSVIRFRHFCSALLAATAAAFLSGCQAPAQLSQYETPASAVATNAASTPVSVPPNATSNNRTLAGSIDLLRPGYKVTVTFSGVNPPPPKHEEKIREDGCITPPLLGRPVPAAGKTIGQFQDDLQKLYVPAYFKTLTVTVTTEDRFFYVGGEVKSEGPRPYLPGMTVLKAIQHAGGFTEFGNHKNVRITRPDGRQETINCDRATRNPKLDIPIFPDDRIDVFRRWH